MTNENCVAAAGAAGYVYAGTEYSGEASSFRLIECQETNVSSVGPGQSSLMGVNRRVMERSAVIWHVMGIRQRNVVGRRGCHFGDLGA